MTGPAGPTGSTGPGGTTGATGQSAILFFGNDNIGSNTDTRFLDPGYGDNSVAPFVAVKIVAPRAGTLRNLFIKHNTPAVSSPSMITYTVQLDGVDVPLLFVTLSAAGTDNQNTANSVVVAQGQDISIKVTKSVAVGGGGGGLKVVLSMEFA